MLLLEIAALAAALWALRRSRLVEELEARIRALEYQIQFLRGEVKPPAPAEETAPEQPEPEAEALPVSAPPREASFPRPAEIEAPRPPALPPPLPPMPPRPPAARPAPSLAAQIDWERWIGVRGAAVLGGVVLALAGIFLFRYSIEHDLIPPWLRVAGGVSAGVACILAAERYLRREYGGTADAVEGGGVVILYASVWAARVLYDLIGTPAAFVLMISITATCCALSWRHASLLISLLGLTGGFATPFLIDSGSDNPIGLFAYVFLLDAALLYLAEKRGWPLLSVLSLAATTLYQAAWIFFRMGPQRTTTGLVVLALSGALFGIASRWSRDNEKSEWRLAQAAGLFLPIAFALYFSVDRTLSPSLLPLALLIGAIDAGACWLSSVQKRPALGLAAAAGSVAVVGVWMSAHGLDGAAWEIAAVAVGLALIFHLAVEWEAEVPGADGPAAAALLAAGGMYGILIAAVSDQLPATAPAWLVAWIGLTALLLRHASFPQRGWVHLVAWGLFALALSNGYDLYSPLTIAGLWIGLAVVAQLVAMRRREPRARLWAEHGAAAFAAAGLLNLPRSIDASPELATSMFAAALILGLLVALVAARLGRGHWLLAAVLLTAASQSATYIQLPAAMLGSPMLLVLAGAGVLLFAGFPFVVGRRFAGDAWAWPAAAIAGVAWFVLLHQIYVHLWSDATIGLLPIALGAIAAAQGSRASSLWEQGSTARRRNLAWFFVVAIGFLTLAIPLQLEKEWITVAWALEGVGVLLLWRRLDVPWLKYFAAALLLAITIRLVANPAVLGYYPRPAWRIVNWLMYLYLVPAAALLGSARILREHEVERARAWEPWYEGGRPLGAVGLGIAGGLVIFVWINLAIADWFSTGPDLQVSLERMPARDLTMSIAWALYALGLLSVGVRLRSVAVRWGSLALMIITIAKVFLYDLGELRDLYRVASLLGLALSLIAVSLAYQRFVLVRGEAVEER